MIDDPEQVVGLASDGILGVQDHRRSHGDAYFCNWRLSFHQEFQIPVSATHDNMRRLVLGHTLPKHTLATNLRHAFSGIVSGNIKDEGIRLVEEFGPFNLSR